VVESANELGGSAFVTGLTELRIRPVNPRSGARTTDVSGEAA